MKPVNVGIVGLGTVGSGTFNVLYRNAEDIARRAGREIVVTHVGARRDNPAVDMGSLDNLQHLVAALKAEGIYTKLSFYFPAWFRLDEWHRTGDRWPFMLRTPRSGASACNPGGTTRPTASTGSSARSC